MVFIQIHCQQVQVQGTSCAWDAGTGTSTGTANQTKTHWCLYFFLQSEWLQLSASTFLNALELEYRIWSLEYHRLYKWLDMSINYMLTETCFPCFIVVICYSRAGPRIRRLVKCLVCHCGVRLKMLVKVGKCSCLFFLISQIRNSVFKHGKIIVLLAC